MKNDFNINILLQIPILLGIKAKKKFFIIKKVKNFLQHEMMLKIFYSRMYE
jgi:hypothetical protein